MIQTHAITKRFDRLQILKGIDIEVHDREIVAIVGPSGAGKTTLLQIVGTLDRPDSGHVIIDGVAPFTLNERRMAAFRNQHIGFVFQFHRLLPEFTALENVMIPALIARDSAAEAERKARELLDFLHLSDRITISRPSSPAAKSNASPWPAPSSTGPASSWPTSPRAASTRIARTSFTVSSSIFVATWARPSSSSPTTKPSPPKPTARYE